MSQIINSNKTKYFSHLPKEWRLSTLEQNVLQKITYGIVQPGSFSNSGIILIRGQDYMNGWVDIHNFFRVSHELHQKYKRSKVTAGDLLMSIAGYVGTVTIVPENIIEANITQTTARISCNERLIDKLFIKYFFQGNDGQLQIRRYGKGSAQEGLNLDDVQKFVIPIPMLPEQKRIASILTSVDDVIKKIQSQISKLQDLKNSVMNDLLTKGIGHKEFKDSEFGQIPQNWEIIELNDSLEIMTDYVANGSFQSLRENVNVKDRVDYALYVRLFDIRKGISHQSQKYVDKNSYNFLKKSPLYGDEILIANIGAYVGEVHLMPKLNEPATLAPNMILLRVSKKCHYKFLYYFLSSGLGQKIIYLLVAGSGQEKLNKTDLKKIKIVLPPMDEQVKISEIILKIEQEILLINKKLSKYIFLKKSLMQDLLTGKVRVSVN